jgi:uncharacterized CHY-type Zn-finger protein
MCWIKDNDSEILTDLEKAGVDVDEFLVRPGATPQQKKTRPQGRKDDVAGTYCSQDGGMQSETRYVLGSSELHYANPRAKVQLHGHHQAKTFTTKDQPRVRKQAVNCKYCQKQFEGPKYKTREDAKNARRQHQTACSKRDNGNSDSSEDEPLSRIALYEGAWQPATIIAQKLSVYVVRYHGYREFYELPKDQVQVL